MFDITPVLVTALPMPPIVTVSPSDGTPLVQLAASCQEPALPVFHAVDFICIRPFVVIDFFLHYRLTGLVRGNNAGHSEMRHTAARDGAPVLNFRGGYPHAALARLLRSAL